MVHTKAQKIEEIIATLEEAKERPRLFFSDVHSYISGLYLVTVVLDLQNEYRKFYHEAKIALGYDYDHPSMYLENILKFTKAELTDALLKIEIETWKRLLKSIVEQDNS